ncbi:hypothetical protein [Umezawaea tangerina]|uniref:Uncharacterized protein n=1 Tax=Umezawaea tangerina TaxID=84725 RepID=A0A2T0SLI6_9PSEU|nr:hypothetical protein [Umezawaea tangerina]PRY34265.1 hypothetical protein CLV43_11738 [Umezawaea tangerina]
MADHPFDEGRLRAAASQVADDLPPDLVDRLITKYGTTAALAEEMTALGRRVWAHLDRRGRTVPPDTYPQFAVALLSVRGRLAGVQQNLANVADVYTRLLAFGDVPVGVAIATRLLKDKDEHLVGPMIVAARTEREVRARRQQPPMFIGMVTAAVVAVGGRDADDLTADVVAVLDRGDILAARHRAGLKVAPGPDAGYPVLGNADVVGQIAAYRVAIAEMGGVAASEQVVAAHGAQLATSLRRAMTTTLGGAEPDVLKGLLEFARFLGGPEAGESTEKIFGKLHPEFLSPMEFGGRYEVPVEHDSPALTGAVGGTADELLLHADHVARWVLVELFAGTRAPEQEVLTAWLTGCRPPDAQEGMAFLVDRVRRVDRRLRGPAGELPELVERAGTAAAFAVVRSNVRDALTLDLDGALLTRSIFPPLWTQRDGAVRLVASKLRLAIGRGVVNSAKASLVAAVVVRAPAQQVRRAVDLDRPETCSCDDGPRPVEEVCPHRPWGEAGRVEDYTTLTRFSGFSTESTTRMHVKRYDGPWREWMREVREEAQ